MKQRIQLNHCSAAHGDGPFTPCPFGKTGTPYKKGGGTLRACPLEIASHQVEIVPLASRLWGGTEIISRRISLL